MGCDQSPSLFNKALAMRRVAMLFLFTLTLSGCAGGQDDPPGKSRQVPLQPLPEADAAYTRGRQAHGREQYDQAIADFNEAIRLDPTSPLAHEYRGSAWHKKGQHDKAIADYTAAIQLQANSPSAFVSRADCWLHKKAFEKAIADCNEAILFDPKYAAAFYTRGHAWRRKKQYDEAIADYDDAVRFGFNNSELCWCRAECWYAKRDFKKSIADYEEAVRFDPKDHASLNNLATIFATASVDKLRDGKRAVELARRALDLDQKNPRYMPTLAAAFAEIGDFTEAVRWQERAMENPVYKSDPQAQIRLEAFRRMEPLRTKPLGH